jgi:hypothetical protein
MATLKNVTQNLISLKESLDNLEENGMDDEEFEQMLLDGGAFPDYEAGDLVVTYAEILRECRPGDWTAQKDDYTTSEIGDLETQIKDLETELEEMAIETTAGYKITPISKDHYWTSFEDMPLLKDGLNYFIQDEAWSDDLYPLYVCIKEDWGYAKTVVNKNATKDQINYLINMLRDHYF